MDGGQTCSGRSPDRQRDARLVRVTRRPPVAAGRVGWWMRAPRSRIVATAAPASAWMISMDSSPCRSPSHPLRKSRGRGRQDHPGGKLAGHRYQVFPARPARNLTCATPCCPPRRRPPSTPRTTRTSAPSTRPGTAAPELLSLPEPTCVPLRAQRLASGPNSHGRGSLSDPRCPPRRPNLLKVPTVSPVHVRVANAVPAPVCRQAARRPPPSPIPQSVATPWQQA